MPAEWNVWWENIGEVARFVITVVGGFSGLILGMKQIIDLWTNRARVSTHMVTTARYAQKYKAADVQTNIDSQSSASGEGKKVAEIAEGDVRNLFTVIEIIFLNRFPRDVVIGRFQIDHWMFGERYKPEMYDSMMRRDYRVAHLYSKQPLNLSEFHVIPSSSSIGLRIEILEETHPAWNLRTRRKVQVPSHYEMRYILDGKQKLLRIELTEPEDMTYQGFGSIYHLSDLIREPNFSTAGDALPQGVQKRSN